jgi:predicted phosphohydrolase
VNEACFINSWEQGDLWHPNISEIGRKFLNKTGYGDIEVKSILLDRNTTVFANYIVGSRRWWKKFMEFSRRIFTEAEKDSIFKQEVFGLGGSNYAHDKTLPNFTFLIERLIPTFIELENFSSIGFKHNPQTIPEKYNAVAEEIYALSDLKVLVNQHNSDEIFNIWNFYRHKFLQQNPEVLRLE